MKQYEVVQLALARSGGFATLGQLYQVVTKMPEWQSGSLTPYASVRCIVQETPGIFRIRPGLWGLEAQKAVIGLQLALPEYAPPAKSETYSHSFYQGLLVELGNLQHLQTAVPAQDKNKPFLTQTLAAVATLPKPYDFTFPETMSHARTIDVSWFNVRRFPTSFFEVEHSTDIYNSLRKFVEFQDFKLDFWIVADQDRKGEFDKKRQATAYAAVADRVKFLSYDQLSDWHSKLSESAAQEAAIQG